MKEQDSAAEGLERTRRIRLDVDVDVDSIPPITHGIHPKPVYPNRITVYIPMVDEAWVRPALKALERDGSSFSAWTLARLHEYWEAHNPGNPQTPLEKWGSEGDLGLGEKPRILDYKAAVLDEMSVEELLVTVQDFTLSLNEKRYIAWLIMEKRIRQGLQNKE